MKFAYKIGLAALSGLSCFFILAWEPELTSVFEFLLGYGLSGLLFAVGVLFPYLGRDRGLAYRGLVLIVVSVVGYWCAVRAFAWGDGFPGAGSFIVASFVGASIVLTGSRLIVPLHGSVRLAVTGLAAATVGGLVFASLDYDQFYVAFMAWHVLMTAAIHIAQSGIWRNRQKAA